jgi:hypothetical protein
MLVPVREEVERLGGAGAGMGTSEPATTARVHLICVDITFINPE